MNNLPVNWFDVALLLVLGFGLFRGRKNGMTKEIVPTAEWLILVVAAGLGYSLLAHVYTSSCHMSVLLSAVLGYLTIALVVFLVFTAIKKTLVPRLTGSSIFGSAEYYLGMLSGMIRYACIVIFFLALINAKHYTAAEIAAKQAYNQRWYGGGLYSGNYIPDLRNVQDGVFKESFSGQYIKDYLGMMLIQTGPGTGQGPEEKKPQAVVHIGN